MMFDDNQGPSHTTEEPAVASGSTQLSTTYNTLPSFSLHTITEAYSAWKNRVDNIVNNAWSRTLEVIINAPSAAQGARGLLVAIKNMADAEAHLQLPTDVFLDLSTCTSETLGLAQWSVTM